MVGDEPFLDLVSIEQDRAAAGVFAENEIAQFERCKSSLADIVEMADGGGYEV